MGLPTGDYVQDFTGLSNVNPYTNSNFTLIDAGKALKIVSGALLPASAYGAIVRWRWNGTVTGGATLRAKLEAGVAHSSDGLIPCLLAANGSGYIFYVSNTSVNIKTIDTTGSVQGGLASGTAASAASGDIFMLELVPGTHTLNGYLNGSLVSGCTTVDSTFTTGLAPGFAFDPSNNNTSTALGFAADGVSVGGGTSISVLSSPHMRRRRLY